jgi:hypothetical protein
VRPVLDIGTALAVSSYKSDIQLIKAVQRRARRCISRHGKKPYSERISTLKLPSLTFECQHSDIPLI